MTDLLVSEIFGPTVQGEGPFTGRLCSFVRLGLCNLSCSWCDTPYTWDWQGKNGTAYDRKAELTRMTTSEVIAELDDRRASTIVISGGEPFVQRAALTDLVERLHGCAFDVQIETNGTHMPLDFDSDIPVHYNVSPKLAHSGDAHNLRINRDALMAFADESSVAFKFVCKSVEDLDEVASLVKDTGIFFDDVWIMPEGRDTAALEQHLSLIANEAIARCWNISGRLHVNIWGDRRGV